MSVSRRDRNPDQVPEAPEPLAEFPPEERDRLEAILEERSARAHAGGELIDIEVARRLLRLRRTR